MTWYCPGEHDGEGIVRNRFAILGPLTSKNNSFLFSFLPLANLARSLCHGRLTQCRKGEGKIGCLVHPWKARSPNEMHVIVLWSGRFHKMNKQKRFSFFSALMLLPVYSFNWPQNESRVYECGGKTYATYDGNCWTFSTIFLPLLQICFRWCMLQADRGVAWWTALL